ncbi:MAG: hypothetical protein ACYC2R_08605 [Burkholderiales bacterium]
MNINPGQAPILSSFGGFLWSEKTPEVLRGLEFGDNTRHQVDFLADVGCDSQSCSSIFARYDNLSELNSSFLPGLSRALPREKRYSFSAVAEGYAANAN